MNLGQPDEDFDVVKGKAIDLGALACEVIDAREEFAARVRAAGDQGQRPLRRRLPAVHRARPAADRQAGRGEGARARLRRIAHGCTGKGNDQVRIDATVLALGPELKIVAPVRNWKMGREEEIAYAREHGIPVKGGSEATPYSIDDNIWGRSSEGGAIEDLAEPPRDDVFELVTDPHDAPDEHQDLLSASTAGSRVAGRREARAGRADRPLRRPPAAATAWAFSTTSRIASSG